MVDTIELNAELREEFGKGAARRIRREHKIPAVLYGHGTEPLHITLPGHQTMLALRQSNALLTLHIEGEQDRMALPKQVQRHPVSNEIRHVDLILVKRGERVIVSVPVIVNGEPEDRDALLNQDRNEISVSAEATNIPEEIQISVEGLKIGDQITAADVKLPEGVQLDDAEDVLIVSIVAPISEEALEAELETEGEDAGEAEAEEASEEGASEE